MDEGDKINWDICFDCPKISVYKCHNKIKFIPFLILGRIRTIHPVTTSKIKFFNL